MKPYNQTDSKKSQIRTMFDRIAGHYDLLNSIMESFDRIDYIKAADIPNIDLYMDQVTTLMESRLRSSARYPQQDKILTKTMINK